MCEKEPTTAFIEAILLQIVLGPRAISI
jgi:hypothetical protein